jgi:hypothetical protein
MKYSGYIWRVEAPYKSQWLFVTSFACSQSLEAITSWYVSTNSVIGNLVLMSRKEILGVSIVVFCNSASKLFQAAVLFAQDWCVVLQICQRKVVWRIWRMEETFQLIESVLGVLIKHRVWRTCSAHLKNSLLANLIPVLVLIYSLH